MNKYKIISNDNYQCENCSYSGHFYVCEKAKTHICKWNTPKKSIDEIVKDVNEIFSRDCYQSKETYTF